MLQKYCTLVILRIFIVPSPWHISWHKEKLSVEEEETDIRIWQVDCVNSLIFIPHHINCSPQSINLCKLFYYSKLHKKIDWIYDTIGTLANNAPKCPGSARSASLLSLLIKFAYLVLSNSNISICFWSDILFEWRVFMGHTMMRLQLSDRRLCAF